MPEPTNQNANSAPPQTPQQVAAVIEDSAERVFLKHCAEQTRKGIPLKRAELTRLNAIRHGSDSAVTFASNQSELATILDVSRKTIQRALEKDDHPGTAPDGRYEVKPWRDYLARTNEHLAEGERTSIKSERARNLALKNDKLEFELAVLRKDYRSTEEVESDTTAMIQQARRVLETGPTSLAPQVVGLTIHEAESLLREWVQNSLAQLHNDPLGTGDAPQHSRAKIIDESG